MSEHNHECGCGCDCGCGHDHHEDLFVTLTLEDNTELKCEVVAMFPASNDKQYVAVTPASGDSEELYFFRLEPSGEEEGEFTLCDIEDDDELELVADAFDELLDEQEWAELTEE